MKKTAIAVLVLAMTACGVDDYASKPEAIYIPPPCPTECAPSHWEGYWGCPAGQTPPEAAGSCRLNACAGEPQFSCGFCLFECA